MESLCPPATSFIAAPVNSSLAMAPACLTAQVSYCSSLFNRQTLHIRTSCYVPSTVRCTRDIRCSAVSSETSHAEDNIQLKSNTDDIAPNSFEVQSLLMELCDETSIAELGLKIGDFKLHVKRDVNKFKGSHPPSVPVAPPVPSKPMEESGALVAPQPPPKAPATKSAAAILSSSSLKSSSKFGLLEAAADEGLHFVTSPKVGLFRRSRVVKKKMGRPLCEEGQIVKKGQVICYVEQLGTQQPVEADNSGEVIKILYADGEPVGYGDPLIAVRPSFAGIK